VAGEGFTAWASSTLIDYYSPGVGARRVPNGTYEVFEVGERGFKKVLRSWLSLARSY